MVTIAGRIILIGDSGPILSMGRSDLPSQPVSKESHRTRGKKLTQ
jgi:hypothetical protein